MADIDLNLLRVFDTLMELRSVTRAAGRLGVTQSAVSHALGRLRYAIGDPLFVRGTGGLQPTARAIEIGPGVREALLHLRTALSPSRFDPATAERRFTISASYYFCALLVPDLLERVRRVAPGVSFMIVAPGLELVAALDEGVVDLALGAFGRVPARLIIERLFREEFVWVAATGSDGADGPASAEALAGRPRLTIASDRPSAGLGGFVRERGLDRLVAASDGMLTNGERDLEDSTVALYDSVTAIAVVERTDLVALVPRRFAERAAVRGGLVIVEPDPPAAGVEVAMLWHNKLDADGGLAWLRSLIRETIDASRQSGAIDKASGADLA